MGKTIYDSIDNYTVFDIETTGVSKKDKITEIAILTVRDNVIVDKYSQLVNPKMPIPYYITQLTGISNAMVRNQPTIEEIAPIILEKFNGEILMGHNVARFDMNFLSREISDFLETEKLDNDRIDTLYLAKKYIDSEDGHSLSVLVDKLHLYQNTHRALADCMATKELYDYIKTKMIVSTLSTLKQRF